MKEKNEYYISRIYSRSYSRLPIFGKWRMFIEFIHFLNNPNYLSLSIGKMNNYKVGEYAEFGYDEDNDKFILKTK